MPLGDIRLSSNFELSSQRPLDARLLVLDITERDAIPFVKRYPMMFVSVLSELKSYQLKYATIDSGLNNNANWVEFGVGTQADWDAVSGPASILNKPGNASITEDGLMSSVDKIKLTGIADGAEVNVNADWNAISGDAVILNKPSLSQLHTQNTDYQILGPSSLIQSNNSSGTPNQTTHKGIIKYETLTNSKILSKFRFWNTSALLTGYVLEVYSGIIPGGLPQGHLGTTADTYITVLNTLLKRVNISSIVQNGWAEFNVNISLPAGDYSLAIYRPGQLGVNIGYNSSSEIESLSNYKPILTYGLNSLQVSGGGYQNLKFQIDYGTSNVIADTGGVAINGTAVTVNGLPITGSNTGDQDLSGLLKLDQTIPQSIVNGFLGIDKGFDLGIVNANPLYKEGRVFYDNGKKTLAYHNDIFDITVNVGQEILIPIYNNTIAIIPNGSLVYPTGVFGDRHTIALANAFEPEKCRLLAMTTHAIPINGIGYATRFGSVGGLNTNGQSGIVYLSPFIEGKWTTTRPTDSNFAIAIGVIKESDLVNGSITMDPTIVNTTVEQVDTNGFPELQRAKSQLTYNNGTRTLTHTPITGHVAYYQTGKKYITFTTETIVWDDIEGFHYIYYNLGVLSKISNPTEGQIRDMILNKCLVCIFYWNATDKEIVFDLLDARHGISVTPFTHYYTFLTSRSVYESGLKLNNFIANAAGDLDTHAQFSANEGRFFVQDLEMISESKAVGDTIDVIYFDGVSKRRTDSNTGFAILNAPAGRPYFNFFDTGNWTLSEVTNGYYVMYHIVAVNGINKGYASFPGITEYATFNNAQEASHVEMHQLLSMLTYKGTLPVGSIIFHCSNSYTNAVKAKIVSVFPNENYVDWTLTSLADGISSPNHTELRELYLVDSNILFGHISYRDQTIYGAKTFNSFPITPSLAPTTNYEVANKKYVDDISFNRPALDAFFNSVFSTQLNSTEVQRGLDSRFGTGIPIDEKRKFKIVTSFNAGNITASIAFVGAYTEFFYYINNRKFIVTVSNIAAYTQTYVAASENAYFFYINQHTVSANTPIMILSIVPWTISDPDVLLWNMYFNSTTNAVERIGNEKHAYGRDITMHPRHHAQGAVYSSGLALSQYNGITNANVVTNTDNNFGRASVQIAGGTFFDEDIRNVIAHSGTAMTATWTNPETDWEKTVYQFLGFTAIAAIGTSNTQVVFPSSRVLITGQAVTIMAGNTQTVRGTVTITAGGTGTTFAVTIVTGTGFTTGDAIVVGARIPIYYIDQVFGGSYRWRKLATTDFIGVAAGAAVTTANIGSGTFQVNNAVTGGFSDMIANRYFPMFLLATNFINEPVIAVLGQGQSTSGTLSTALGEAPFQYSNLVGLPGLNLQEVVPFYRLAFFYNTNPGSNQNRMRLVDATFINVRASTSSSAGLSGGGGTTDHSLLTNRTWLNSGHNGGLNKLPSFDAGGLASETDPNIFALWAGGTFTGPIKSTKKSVTPLDLVESIYLSSDNTIGIRQYGLPTNNGLYIDILHPTAGDKNIVRIDTNGIYVDGSVQTTNGVTYGITPKIATDLPSTYPQGTTSMYISNDGSWIESYGLVNTYNSGTVYQTFQSSKTPYKQYTRTKTDGANTWEAWKVFVGGSGTTDELAYWSANNALGTLPVATYPSKIEISYVKGVTSSIQTQLGNKAPLVSPVFTGTVQSTGLLKGDIGIQNGDYISEKFLGIHLFTAAANRAINILFGSNNFYGNYEVTVTGVYGGENGAGFITKTFGFLGAPGGTIYSNVSSVIHVNGDSIGNTISIGEIRWDAGLGQYVLPISHLVSTSNHYYVKIKSYSISGIGPNVTLSSEYSLTALAKNYVNFPGNVGIGIASPISRLEISAAGNGYWNDSTDWNNQSPPLSTITISNITNGGYDSALLFRQTDSVAVTKNAGAIGLIGKGSWVSGNNATQISDMYFAVKNNIGGISERMRIKYDGNVGIGIASPANKLDVAGNISVHTLATNPPDSATMKGLTFGYDNSTEQSWIQANRNNVSETRRLLLNPNGGNVGIGTARPITIDGTNGVIAIKGEAGGWVIGTNFIGSNNTGLGYFGAYGSVDTLVYYFIGTNYAAPLFRIEPSGAATFSNTVTATNFILGSDLRLKENITPISILNIDSVELKQFNLIFDTEKRTRYGVIAQELELVAPEMVYTDEKGFKSIGYTDFLIAKVASLEAKNNALEARLDRLENLILEGK